MRRQSPIAPIDSPRDFGIHEVFFSTTNRKGIIAYGNRVFARVSGYPIEEMMGQPHNMIRHPDVPRAVFKLFWDYLLAGKPVAAYVKNMAADGRYYWVVALAAPIADGGFLSVRFKPSSRLFDSVPPLYADLRAVEQAHGDRAAGMAAAAARLEEWLKSQGFGDYEAFMHALLHQELTSRDRLLSQDKLSVFPPLPSSGSDESALGRVLGVLYGQSQPYYERLHRLYDQLDRYARVQEEIDRYQRAILDQTKKLRVRYLNLTVTAGRLGEAGKTLSAIARNLGDAASQMADTVAQVSGLATRVAGRLGEVIFSLGWARAQFEMQIVFYHEVFAQAADPGERHRVRASLGRLADLQYTFAQTIQRAEEALHSLQTELTRLAVEVEDLRKATLLLQVTYVGGRVEAARRSDLGTVTTIFADVRSHIEDMTGQLSGFKQGIDGLNDLASRTPEILRLLAELAERMRADQQMLTQIRTEPESAPEPDGSSPAASRPSMAPVPAAAGLAA